MSDPHHDSAAFLEVIYQAERPYRVYPKPGVRRVEISPAGWWVRRICKCHRHELVSVRFDTEAEAERCLRALDDDCRQRLAGSGNAVPALSQSPESSRRRKDDPLARRDGGIVNMKGKTDAI